MTEFEIEQLKELRKLFREIWLQELEVKKTSDLCVVPGYGLIWVKRTDDGTAKTPLVDVQAGANHDFRRD